MALLQIEQISHYNALSLRVIEIPALKIMLVEADGQVPTDVYRPALTLAVDVAVHNGLLFWLVNNKISGILALEDQIWANEVLAPRIAKETIIQKMAFVEPQDVLSCLILENMMNLARDVFPFDMQFFETCEDALEWFSEDS